MAAYGKCSKTLYHHASGFILDQASLVKLGGRLIYATCSVLPQENEDQIQAFLSRAEMFRGFLSGPCGKKSSVGPARPKATTSL